MAIITHISQLNAVLAEAWDRNNLAGEPGWTLIPSYFKKLVEKLLGKDLNQLIED